MANFDLFFPKLLKHEGGYVDNPLDPGGATNKGITLKTFRDTTMTQATKQDLKNISDSQVKKIYKTNYWDALQLDSFIHQPLAETMMDFGVNAGVSRAIKTLQYVITQHGVNINIDGKLGKMTLTAIKQLNNDTLYNKYNQVRQQYYQYRTGTLTDFTPTTTFFKKVLNISPNPTQKIFEKGWLSRVSSFKPIEVAGIGVGTIIVGISFFF